MEIFKYYDENGLLALRELQLKVTPPNEFHDPFEMSPLVRTADPKALAGSMAKKFLTEPKQFERHRSWFPHCKSFRDFQKHGRANMGKMIAIFEANVRRFDRETEQEMLEFISAKYGVVCFTSDPVQPLMWAHYGASHKGMVIGYEATDPLFTKSSFLRVDYEHERAVHDPLKSPNQDDVEIFVRRKSWDWRYEKESRLVLHLAQTIRRHIGGRICYFRPIRPSSITSVTFGLRAGAALKKEIWELLRKPEFSHITAWKIVQNDVMFEFGRLKAEFGR